MAHPEKAIHEAWRILRKGRRFAFTVWHGPEQGGEFFALYQLALIVTHCDSLSRFPARSVVRGDA